MLLSIAEVGQEEKKNLKSFDRILRVMVDKNLEKEFKEK